MRYIHSDHLNTPQAVTDENQGVVWKADYKPFGEAEPTVTTLDMPLRFPGQYHDQETGLNYNYFRTYNPATGRYTQSDPIGLRAGLNTYRYTGDPITTVDPLGLAVWDVTGIFEASGAYGVGASYFNIELESQCYNGKRYRVRVHAVGAAAGIQLRCKVCFSAPAKVQMNDAQFEDHSGSDRPDPGAFNGPFLVVSAEAQFQGFGGGLGDMLLGRATNVGSGIFSIGFGTFSLGVSGAIGTSTVTESVSEDCDECK